ncbi:MAG TPA: carboxypeptidase regulatory-like domain-containing protein [Thermoanaerobaculia bacterium]|nr:carboxypeptidase regulatory-like domain-containing protein [Thermoanaerobaculia bacterium]
MRRALVAGLLVLGLSGAALAAPLPVRGSVRKAGGAPLAGARVELSPVLGNHAWNGVLLRGELRPPVVAAAETDAEGRFSLAAPTEGIWRVEVRAEGFVPMRWFPLPLTGPVELPPAELLKDAGVKAEVVEAAGGAASGVVVVAETASKELWAALGSPGWSVASRNGVTDAQGRVTLPRAAGETLQLTALRPGSLVTARQRVEGHARMVLAAARLPLTLEAKQPGGSPLPDLVVVAGDPAWPVGRTGEQGRLSIQDGGSPGPVALQLFAGDGRRWRTELPPRPEGSCPFPLVLNPPAWVSGRVLDAASRRPVAGARVWPGHDPGASVVTGADGSYRLAAPPEERFWIQAEAAGRLSDTAWVTRSAAAAGQAPTLALAAAASAAGQVVDRTGKPVPGAEVAGFVAPPQRRGFHPDPADARAVTDADGRFALAGLHPDAAFEVAVERKGFLPVRETLARRPDLRWDLKFVLERSRPGSGRVVDAGDRPLSGVEVRLSPSGGKARGRGGPERTGPAAVTDGEGRFRIEELPARELDIEARKPGFAPRIVRRLPVLPGDGTEGPADLGTLVLHPGAAARGRVTDAAGRPLAGTEVWLVEDDGGPPLPAAQIARGKPAASAGHDGRFAVEDLEAGRRIHLAAGRKGYVTAAVRGIEVPTREPVVLVLEEAARVSGEVVTEGGEPVAGAAVHLGGRSLPAGTVGIPIRPAELARQAAADAAGRFVLEEVASGEAELRAEAEGFQPSAPVPVTIVPGKSVDGVRLVLSAGAALAGTVSMKGGGPAAGARVTVGPVSALADADGLYRVAGIPPGPREVEVRHPGSNRQVRQMEIEAGTNAADFLLDGGQPVAGRVMDEAGEPVEGARVEIRLQDPWDPHTYTAASDDGGGFVFPTVAAGLYDLRAGGTGYAESEAEGAVRVEGRPVEGVQVVLRRGVTVSGRLLGLSFEELAAAEVAAEAPHGGSRGGTVDYQGVYEIPDLAPGDWLVRGSVRGRNRQAEARVTLAPGAREMERDLRFGGGLTLTGSVSHGGEPLSEARVSAHGFEAAMVRSGMTDHQGSFRLEGLEPGRYRLSISSAREMLNYNEVVEVLADRDVVIDVPTAQVSGSVISEATSQPVPRVVVYLQQLVGDGGGQGASVINVITDEAGRFLVGRVLAGRHRLTVRHPGHAPAEQIVEVQAGASLDGVEIRLSPADGLEAVVRLASGRVPPGLAVAVFDGAGRQVAVEGQTPDAAGRARFATVPPGAWEVLVTGTGGVGVRVPVKVPGPPVEVVLPDAGRVRVRVPSLAEANAVATLVLLGPDGRPFESLNPFGHLQREWLLPGGSGTVEGLPPGAWRARVAAPDGQVWEGETAVAAGGESELVLP